MDYVKPDLVCATESWLISKPPDTTAIKSGEIFPPGYASYRNDRSTLGGGVFILANENRVSGEIPEASGPDEGEVIWIKVQTQGNKELYIGSFYVTHRQKAHLDCLDRSLQKITVKKDRHIILCGDFNCPDIDWDTHSPPPTPTPQVQAIDKSNNSSLTWLRCITFTRCKTCQHVRTTFWTWYLLPTRHFLSQQQMHQIYQTMV